MSLKAICLLCLLFFAVPVMAQEGTAGHETGGAAPVSVQPPRAGKRLPFGLQGMPLPSSVGTSGAWRWIVDTQRALHKKLAEEMRALQESSPMKAALILIGISFAYGVIHAAGPGHGKAVISSYMLANKTTLKRGILIAVLAAMVQACSAVVLVGVLVLIMKRVGLEMLQVAQHFDTVSGLLIVAAGLYFLTVHLRRQFGFRVASSRCVAVRDEMPDPRTLEKKLALRELIAIVVAVGIRPCTGALIAIFFAMKLGILWAGVVSAFVMAAGTSITVSTLAALAVGSRDLAARFIGSRWIDRFYDYATIAACLLVTVIGAGLFWLSLEPMQSF